MEGREDEFDIEIEDASFDIGVDDEEGQESGMTDCYNLSRRGTNISEDDNLNALNLAPLYSSTGKEMKRGFLGSSPETCSKESVIRTDPMNSGLNSNVTKMSPPCFTNTNNDLSQIQKDDDEYDAIFTQIDDGQFINEEREKHLMTPTNPNGNCESDKITVQESKTPGLSSFASLTLDRQFHTRNYNDKMSSVLEQSNSVASRFPGPAGCLPKIKIQDLKFVNSPLHPLGQQVSKIISQCTKSGSQNNNELGKVDTVTNRDKKMQSELLLDQAPWKCMLQSVSGNMDDSDAFFNTFSIRNIRATLRRLPATAKVPFIAGVVNEELQLASSKQKSNPSIKIMDSTGAVTAAVDKKFIDAFGDQIVPGTAIALLNCGILKFKKQGILSIRKRNVMCIAASERPNVTTATIPSSKCLSTATESGVRVLQFATLNEAQIFQDYENLLSMAAFTEDDEENMDMTDYDPPTQPQQLFSAVSGSRPKGTNNNENNLAPGAPMEMEESSQNCNNICIQPGSVNYDESSVFDDDDDDEIMQALENIDFLIEEDDNSF